jgi:hypothetical protein
VEATKQEKERYLYWYYYTIFDEQEDLAEIMTAESINP